MTKRLDTLLRTGPAWCVGLFTTHPKSVGETYVDHLCFAVRFGASMVVGGLACMLHGLLPFCLTTSGSRRVRELYGVLSSHSRRGSAVEPRDYRVFTWTI